jgi:hypothetical protein
MRRWPLRLVLGTCLFALLVFGFEVDHAHHVASAAPTTLARTKGPSTTVHSTTPTSVPAHVSRATRPQPPISSRASFKPPGRGCRFSTTTATSVPPTTTTVPSTTDASSTTLATSKSAHATRQLPIGRCVVLEVGDSLGNDLGWGLAREASTTRGLVLVQKDLSSSGLVTAWFYNWPRHFKTYLAQYRPQLVIMTFGANDEQGIVVKGHAAPFGSAEWHRAYTARILQMARMASKAGSYVLWVGLPIMEPTQYRQGASILNSLYATVATRVPGVTFLPTWNLLATWGGQFRNAAWVNGAPSVLRQPDGIHFTVVGENVLATYVAQQIAAIYHVSFAPAAPMAVTR